MRRPKSPRPTRKLELFRQLYCIASGKKTILATVLAGHLVIEFLLTELVIQRLGSSVRRDVEELSHSELIKKNQALHTVDESLVSLLKSINRIRNRFAHELDFQPSKADWLALFEEAETILVDSTNGIGQGLEEIRSTTSLDSVESWVFAELFIQTAYDLHALYVFRGGDSERFHASNAYEPVG